MGTITSGTGIISGIDTANLIDQLIAIESRPLTQIRTRITTTQTQRTAFMTLSARLLAIKNAASQLDERSYFRSTTAASSNTSVLTATTGKGATAGSYSLYVHSLVSTQQLVSTGYATADETPVGAGRISLDSSKARLDSRVMLNSLNGLSGIQGGTIRITDRSGETVDVDLTTAVYLDDVVDAINSQYTADVRASIDGDRIVLTDLTGETTSNLIVQDLRGGTLAEKLGIAGSVAADVMTGGDINNLTLDTELSTLNDGNGIRKEVSDDFQISLTDGTVLKINLSANLIPANTNLGILNSGNGVRLGVIKITDRSGASAEVDLTGATTMQDIVDAINGSGVGVKASIIGDHLLVTDTTNTADPEDEDAVMPTLTIEDVSGYAALDLGISGKVKGTSITGSSVYRINTVGDVVRVINYAEGNDGKVIAGISADGNGLTLTDNTGSGLMVTAIGESKAAEDLGLLDGTLSGNTLTSRDLIAGLNTVLLRSLNGGTGVGEGTISFTARDGTTSTIDTTGIQSVQELIDQINATSGTSKITASLNDAGNGIQIADISGGSGNLIISDQSGTAATDLRIAGTFAATDVDSGNLQKQYISEDTLLDDVNNGSGVSAGRFRITASSGKTAIIDLTQGNERTLRDVIDEINSRAIGTIDPDTGEFRGIVASINATGDGLLITDTSGGSGRLKIVEVDGGPVAADLNILGEAKDGENFIDGSFEVEVEVDADDSLEEVVSKINASDAGVTASLLNTGGASGYRLSITATTAGTQGEVIFDSGGTGLNLSTMVKAKDAVLFLGEPGQGSAIPIVSSSNTITDVIPGVTLNLVGTYDQPVTVTIATDVEGILSTLSTFVETYNSAVAAIDDLTYFDSETLERGTLFGDQTVSRIRSSLSRMILDQVDGVESQYSWLSSVGIKFESGALSIDEDKFREALSDNPEAVTDLFTTLETGAGVRIMDVLDSITSTDNGLITTATGRLQDTEDLLSERVTDLEARIEAKRAQLEARFAAMETALAALQDQQSALSSLYSLISSSSSS